MSDKQFQNDTRSQQSPSACSQLTSVGEVQHANYLSDSIGALYLNDDYADTTLLVDGRRLPSHRVILAARSEYFRALLYGGLRESTMSEIEINETSLGAFKLLLRYIYTGRLSLQKIREEILLEILGLTHKYGFTDLEAAITNFLKTALNAANLCHILGAAQMFSLTHLADYCLQFADQNADVILNADSFCTLPALSVVQLISRDSFCANEIDIFLSLRKWAQQNNVQINANEMQPDSTEISVFSNSAVLLSEGQEIRRRSTQDEWDFILRHVRLPLMKLEELLDVVRPSGLISSDCILDAIREQTLKRGVDLPYRGLSMSDVNVARPDLNAVVIEGELKQALLNGDSESYDMERGFTRHPIEERTEGIVVQLGASYIINHIRLLLWDRDQRSYSYYVEISIDKSEWTRVVDYRRYLCRSWQKLFFAPRVTRYIRVIGTHNTVNRVFHLVTLEAMHSTENFLSDPDTGIVSPLVNVATVEQSACVIEGVSRSRNALINGDSTHYDWDSGYTCHQIGSGAIVVQLCQPFLVRSVRLLLWDCDDRSYGFIVEISADQVNWQIVADRSSVDCKSWQLVLFDQPVAASFVRVTGTRNTANEVFHCVAFECPAVIISAPN